jgi:N-methylhydantoinase B
VTNPSQNLSNTPVEVLEAEHPVRIEDYSLLPDSCGAGRFRGGLGVARTYRLLSGEATLQLRADRMRFRPYGLNGGEPARAARNILNPGAAATLLPAKVTSTMTAGDVVRHEQPGGGGHGDPALRDPAAVAEDVLDGKISVEFARRAHGLEVDPVTGRYNRVSGA